MTDELKKCPFCGGEAFEVCGDVTDFKTFIGCRGCQVSTNEYTKPEDAIEAWNRRI